jgi:hypothetical protein
VHVCVMVSHFPELQSVSTVQCLPNAQGGQTAPQSMSVSVKSRQPSLHTCLVTHIPWQHWPLCTSTVHIDPGGTGCVMIIPDIQTSKVHLLAIVGGASVSSTIVTTMPFRHTSRWQSPSTGSAGSIMQVGPLALEVTLDAVDEALLELGEPELLLAPPLPLLLLWVAVPLCPPAPPSPPPPVPAV